MLDLDSQLAIIRKYDKMFTVQLAHGDNLIDEIMSDIHKKLYTELNDKALDFATTNGILDFSTMNLTKAAEFDKIFEKYRGELRRTLEMRYIPQIEKFYELARDYYTELGFTDAVAVANRVKPLLFQAIGLTEKGNILQGSFYDKFIGLQKVTRYGVDTVTMAISSKKGLVELRKDLKNSIYPDKRALSKMIERDYLALYDIFNQAHEMANRELAVELGLEYFIYQGSLITTSRPFCTAHAGRVYSVAHARKYWPNSPLLRFPNRALYDFSIHRGGIRCRHWIRYISKDAAFALGYDPEKEKFDKQ